MREKFFYLLERPMLWASFGMFFCGRINQNCFFVYMSIKSSLVRNNYFNPKYIIATFGSTFLPLYKAIVKMPVYAILRYAFHICLIIVPIWFSGHINLWEDSRRYELYWTPISDA